jgi:hypothetical protein
MAGGILGMSEDNEDEPLLLIVARETTVASMRP